MTGSEWRWLLVGVAGLGLWLIQAWPVLLAMLHPRRLSRVRADRHSDGPLISVIVPARNEAAAIRACITSLLAQDYAPLEVIAVNDRSTDQTGSILDELAVGDARLRVIQVSELPPNWLGKSHANHLGAGAANGQWLLFTDGDILFERSTIRLAEAHAQREGLDHLCLFPGLICLGYFEKAAVCFFGILFYAMLQMRHVRNPLKPKAFCGVGAFNMVSTTAYCAVGGHERLRMEVADDAKLGKLFKMNGFVTDLLYAADCLRVRWQNGFWGVVRGLEKNAFAGAEYRTGRSFMGIAALLALALLPVVGTVIAPGGAKMVYAGWMISEMALLAMAARNQGFSWLVGLAFPVAGAGIAFAITRSVVLALSRGGIYWRETFHSLAELRRGVV